MTLCERELQRLRYWQGQMLRSRDFGDQLRIDAQLRWWHNRALHNAYGVSAGLETSPVLQSGPLTAVRVSPGLAYDCFGRELILQQTQVIPVPPPPPAPETTWVLLVRYKEASPSLKKEEITGVCLGDRPQLQEQAELTWQRTRKVRIEDGVPLAQVTYSDAGPSVDPEFRVILARPLARPRIATGATIPGQTPWESWGEMRPAGNSISLGLQVKIDTSAAGFTEVPCYFGWLQGSLWNQVPREFFPAPFEHVEKPSINGFTFRLWMPELPILDGTQARTTNRNFNTQFLEFARRKKLFVCWLGIQHGPGGREEFMGKGVDNGNC